MSRASTTPAASSRSLRGLLSLVAVVALAACPKEPPPPEPPPPAPVEEPTLATVSPEVFDAWFAARPVTATSIGDHRHDGEWPKLAAADIEADLRRIDDSLAKLDALDTGAMSPEERVDLDVLRNELQLQRFVHEVEQPWLHDPMGYARIIGDGLEDLVSRDYAPIAERAAALASRLEGLPALVDQAVSNLQPGQTMPPHTDLAVGQLQGVLGLLDEIPARAGGAPAAELSRIEAALPAAKEAVQRLHDHVEGVLLPQATAPWRLGKEAFERKLRLTLNTDLSADEVRRLAIFEHAQVRKRMEGLAGELAQVLFTPYRMRTILRQSSTDPETAVTAAVLEELANNRVTPPQLRDRVETNLARLDAFVRQAGLVTLDDQEVLQVIWTPPHQRGVAIAGLAAPGPLDAAKPGLPSFYLVQPVPDDWAQSYRESFLREYNNFMLEILSIHEAIPGHFVQLYYGKREPSVIRRVLANGPFVEGWAVYAEHLMVEAGYAGVAPEGAPPAGVSKRLWKVMNDPELRAKAIALHGLKFYLRTVTNALLDHSIHAGTMDELGAMELMVFRSFQQEGEARAKWTRAQVTATQLSTYFVGAQAWLRLRKQAEERAAAAGQEFDARAFHDEALSHGAPPVHRLPELMGWTGEAAAAESAEPAEAPAETPAEGADSAAGDAEPAAPAEDAEAAEPDDAAAPPAEAAPTSPF